MSPPKLIWHLDHSGGDPDLIQIVLAGVATIRSFLESNEFIDTLVATPAPELPHLVLLDVDLPPLDGAAVEGLLRREARFHDLRVCLLSDMSSGSAQPLLELFGAACVVIKPRTFDDSLALQDRVRAVLDGPLAPAGRLLRTRSAGTSGSP